MDFNLFCGKPNNPDIKLALSRIEDVLRSGVLSNNGPYVKQLESEIAMYLDTEVVTVCNATIGFQVLLQVLDLPKGSEVITPSFTFPAFVHVIKELGYTPVFADVGDNYCLTDSTIADIFTNKTKLIVPAHLFGNLCNLPKVSSYEVPIVYDSAHALGCAYDDGEYAANQGLAQVFSLHSTKLAGCGEGGFISTLDKGLVQKLRQYRNFGYYLGPEYFPQGRLDGFGTNAKMDEIRAALGTVNFSYLPFIQDHLFENHKLYKELLPEYIQDKNCYFSNWSYVVAEVPADKRDKVLEDLYNEKVLARTYFSPLHLNPLYKEHYRPLPNTERIAGQILVLPTGLAIGKPEIEFIVGIIRRSLNG